MCYGIDVERTGERKCVLCDVCGEGSVKVCELLCENMTRSGGEDINVRVRMRCRNDNKE